MQSAAKGNVVEQAPVSCMVFVCILAIMIVDVDTTEGVGGLCDCSGPPTSAEL